MTFAFARVPCDRLFGNSYLRTRVPRSAEKLKWGNETALLDNQCDDIVVAFEERKHELMSRRGLWSRANPQLCPPHLGAEPTTGCNV